MTLRDTMRTLDELGVDHSACEDRAAPRATHSSQLSVRLGDAPSALAMARSKSGVRELRRAVESAACTSYFGNGK